MVRSALTILVAVLAVACGGGEGARTEATFITVASTTSTENSGLFGHLLPEFREKTGIEVRVVAVGTGQAIQLAENGDADVLFVHHRPSEEKFVADGYGLRRYAVMHNDFVLVGPKADPAGVAQGKDAVAALKGIAKAEAPFVSRGDDSGTHKKELSLWNEARIDAQAASGTWYREAGAGMGATLNTAAGMGAYTLTDRGTWISFENRQDLVVVCEGDERLFNPYGVIVVNPAKHPHVKRDAAQAFVDWLVGPEGQRRIADYTIDGQPLFFPDAGK